MRLAPFALYYSLDQVDVLGKFFAHPNSLNSLKCLLELAKFAIVKSKFLC